MALPKIYFHKLTEAALCPRKYTPRSAGYDIYCNHGKVLRAGCTGKVETGISIQFPPNTHGILKSRSGMSANGITVEGGVLDNDYTGPVIVILHNSTLTDYTVKKGEAIAQMLLILEPNISAFCIERDGIESLAPIPMKCFRGEAGFGSSGK